MGGRDYKVFNINEQGDSTVIVEDGQSHRRDGREELEMSY